MQLSLVIFFLIKGIPQIDTVKAESVIKGQIDISE